jgi:hypothetical protein
MEFVMAEGKVTFTREMEDIAKQRGNALFGFAVRDTGKGGQSAVCHSPALRSKDAFAAFHFLMRLSGGATPMEAYQIAYGPALSTQFFELCCEHLPDEWEVSLHVSNNEAGMRLIDPHGAQVDFFDCEFHSDDERCLFAVLYARSREALPFAIADGFPLLYHDQKRVEQQVTEHIASEMEAAES